MEEQNQSTGERDSADVTLFVTPDHSIRASIFTAEQVEQLRQLKAWKPYCIVWGAVNVQTNPHTFEMHADYTRHKLNKYLRSGWLVATIG